MLCTGQFVALATPVVNQACVSLVVEIAANNTKIGRPDLTTDLCVSPEHPPRLSQLIDLFATSYHDLVGTDTIQMKIDTGDNAPITCQLFRCSINKQKHIDEAMGQMFDAGIISPSQPAAVKRRHAIYTKYFSCIDLFCGYWNILLDDDAKVKAVFVSPEELHSLNFMPFGLVNAPSVFQALVARVLEGLVFVDI